MEIKKRINDLFLQLLVINYIFLIPLIHPLQAQDSQQQQAVPNGVQAEAITKIKWTKVSFSAQKLETTNNEKKILATITGKAPSATKIFFGKNTNILDEENNIESTIVTKEILPSGIGSYVIDNSENVVLKLTMQAQFYRTTILFKYPNNSQEIFEITLRPLENKASFKRIPNGAKPSATGTSSTTANTTEAANSTPKERTINPLQLTPFFGVHVKNVSTTVSDAIKVDAGQNSLMVGSVFSFIAKNNWKYSLHTTYTYHGKSKVADSLTSKTFTPDPTLDYALTLRFAHLGDLFSFESAPFLYPVIGFEKMNYPHIYYNENITITEANTLSSLQMSVSSVYNLMLGLEYKFASFEKITFFNLYFRKSLSGANELDDGSKSVSVSSMSLNGTLKREIMKDLWLSGFGEYTKLTTANTTNIIGLGINIGYVFDFKMGL